MTKIISMFDLYTQNDDVKFWGMFFEKETIHSKNIKREKNLRKN